MGHDEDHHDGLPLRPPLRPSSRPGQDPLALGTLPGPSLARRLCLRTPKSTSTWMWEGKTSVASPSNCAPMSSRKRPRISVNCALERKGSDTQEAPFTV